MQSANNNIPKQKTKRKISFLPKEIAESGRPEVNLLTKVLMAVTASLSLLAAFLPFIPIPFEEKYVTETTITNMIGIVGKDLGTDTFRTSGAVFLTIFFVAIVFVAIGVVGILYRDRIAAFFTLCGTGVLVYFWLHGFQAFGRGRIILLLFLKVSRLTLPRNRWLPFSARPRYRTWLLCLQVWRQSLLLP